MSSVHLLTRKSCWDTTALNILEQLFWRWSVQWNTTSSSVYFKGKRFPICIQCDFEIRRPVENLNMKAAHIGVNHSEIIPILTDHFKKGLSPQKKSPSKNYAGWQIQRSCWKNDNLPFLTWIEIRLDFTISSVFLIGIYYVISDILPHFFGVYIVKGHQRFLSRLWDEGEIISNLTSQNRKGSKSYPLFGILHGEIFPPFLVFA